jgi:hypothetical protein
MLSYGRIPLPDIAGLGEYLADGIDLVVRQSMDALQLLE